VQFVNLQKEGYTGPAVMEGGEVISLRGAGFQSMLQVVSGGEDAMDRVRRWIYGPPGSQRQEAHNAMLAAPIPRPHKIICIGLNYRDHAEESNMPIPEVPTVFSKYSSSVIGPLAAIVLPKISTKPDYEAEFAVVIGRGGRHIREDDWRDHVFGYTVINDVSARDFQMATSQWMIGKTFDTFCPMGPGIVSADEIEDPHNLQISLTINGETLQDSNTRNLIFGVPKLIAYLSSVFTLEPGDIISTGTPAGVGFARKPPRWLMPGDEVAVTVQGVGTLINPVVAEQ
jgi:2-keto-4-pentenoate hydratase/2-oxohepta-3-ene-1,7-dioic acid hydratase in catechol pathway